MSTKSAHSNTDLVYHVLREAKQPMTSKEILLAVNEIQPITTKKPINTIRGILSQSMQLVNTSRSGPARYGYLPNLIQGSVLRLPLDEKEPAHHPITYSEEARQALWPSFFETQKRKSDRPVTAYLPNSESVRLFLEFSGRESFSSSSWGTPVPEALASYLREQGATEGDSLLIRILDGERGEAEMWLEPHRERDEEAIQQRNRGIADAAEEIMRDSSSDTTPVWEIVIRLLGRRLYQSRVPPDTLVTVLTDDERFFDTGLHMWMLAEDVDAEIALDFEMRRMALQSLFDPSGGTMEIEWDISETGEVIRGARMRTSDSEILFLDQMMFADDRPSSNVPEALRVAQDVIYDAWMLNEPAERVRLANEALRISPDCADAYVLLAYDTATTLEQALAFYQRGVEAGQSALGKKSFEQDAGMFWGILETRPYMRARFGLADTLWQLGRQDEAIDHLWAMLELNPDDNQGVRYALISWLLTIGDDAQTAILLERYPDDGGAQWLYARALHAFRTSGDTSRTRASLAKALDANADVPAFLLGARPVPEEMPQLITVGGEDEAAYCAEAQFTAWTNAAGALEWLDEQTRDVRASRDD